MREKSGHRVLSALLTAVILLTGLGPGVRAEETAPDSAAAQLWVPALYPETAGDSTDGAETAAAGDGSAETAVPPAADPGTVLPSLPEPAADPGTEAETNPGTEAETNPGTEAETNPGTEVETNPGAEDAPLERFYDVTESHWAYTTVMEMTRVGLFQGIGKPANGIGMFAPEAEMSTSSMAAVVVRYLFPEELAAKGAGDPWYVPVLELAVEKGLLPADTDAARMERIITREETAQLLVRALEARGEPLPALTVAPVILDGQNIRDEYLSAVRTVWVMGMMNGSGDGGFLPGGTLTRAEGAAVLYRLIHPEQRQSVDSRPLLQNLMFLGDSMFANPERGARVFTGGGNQIVAGNGAAAYQFHGITEKEVLVGVEGLGIMRGSLAGRRFNGIVILLGANDLSFLSMEEAVRDYTTLLDELYARYGKCGIPIFALRLYPVGPTYGRMYTESTESRQMRAAEYSARLLELCAARDGVYFLDATAGFTDAQGYLKFDCGDGLHISDRGYRFFYAEIMNALQATGVFRLG